MDFKDPSLVKETTSFKDATTGNWITQGLFFETARDKTHVTYTLKDYDHEVEINGELRTLPSLGRLFIECADVTEYIFATTYLGGWKHWKRIQENKLFKETVEEWREELAVKMMAEGIKAIHEHSKTDKGYQAAKWLAEKGWEEKKRGAPSKEEKARELKLQTKLDQEVGDDLTRILQ